MTQTQQLPQPLVKHELADRLRTEIMKGALRPGERIIEGRWATEFGVAQASIREAINILRDEGFVTKRSGRSARVLHLSEHDVVRLYQLRGAIEGLAARLAATSEADLSPLQFAVDGMREAVAPDTAKRYWIATSDSTSRCARRLPVPF
jgi:DNA-binding GntR family transcriptional regulator